MGPQWLDFIKCRFMRALSHHIASSLASDPSVICDETDDLAAKPEKETYQHEEHFLSFVSLLILR